MMPIWIFAIFIVLFLGVIIWERLDYKALHEYSEILESYLDKYIMAYGAKFGITVENPKGDIDADTKQ
jgi:hypothetical protein